ncbi:MAG: HepT-like ribonuclease domain-containing protein, partial [Bacteroidota bacterium]
QGAYNSASLTIQRAVERELQIIGEAASRLRKMGVELETTDQLINRRNTIVHQYDSFQPRTIWNFVTYQMPLIQKEVEELLKD